jgi:hypothetical protein
MNISTDHAFHIGEQHLRNGKPCQDYALSGVATSPLPKGQSPDKNYGYAIVSDGCSSGGMTDIGARLVSLAARQSLLEHTTSLPFIFTRDAYLRIWQQSLGLAQSDLLATNLVVKMSPNFLSAHIAGDGVLVARESYGPLIARKYEWQKNAPFYPAYNLSHETKDGFRELHMSRQALTVETWNLSTNEPELLSTEHYSVREGMRELSVLESIPSQRLDYFELAAVFSDGVHQVEGMEWQQVVIQLLAFKNTNGQFFTRRMNRFLQDVRKVGRGPLDDIAGAVIHFEP